MRVLALVLPLAAVGDWAMPSMDDLQDAAGDAADAAQDAANNAADAAQDAADAAHEHLKDVDMDDLKDAAGDAASAAADAAQNLDYKHAAAAAAAAANGAFQTVLAQTGACPMLKKSVDNFLDGATDSLTETVEENLHGACHDLDSGACRATMSDKTSDLLLFALESSIGLTKARQILHAVQPMVKKADAQLIYSKCQLNAIKGASQDARVETHLGEDVTATVKSTIQTVLSHLDPVHDKVRKAEASLSTAVKVEHVWNKIKGASKKVFSYVADPAMGKLQEQIPQTVVTAVKSGKETADQLTDQFTSLIQDDLGGILHHQIHQFCPEGGDDGEGDESASSIGQMFDNLQKKVLDMLEDALHAVTGKSVDGEIVKMAGEMSAASGDFDADLEACKQELADHLKHDPDTDTSMWFQDQADFEGRLADDFDHLNQLFQDYPEPHAKHMAMLYLRSTVQPKSTTTVTHTKVQVERYGVPVVSVVALVAAALVAGVFLGRRSHTSGKGYIECKPMDREVTDDMQMTTLLVSDDLYSV